jgi:Uncharacterized protein conserved in bacteria
MEIERKYLVKYIPENINEYECHEVMQGYIYTDPVIRIRRSDERFYLTVKTRGLLEREEFETPITEDAFNELSKKCEGNLISKTRYKIPLGEGLIAELDIFHDIFDGLRYVEVEFPSVEAAESFTAPDFFGREVTEEPKYQNSGLSSMKPEQIKDFMNEINND